jgi:hypothetical protein
MSAATLCTPLTASDVCLPAAPGSPQGREPIFTQGARIGASLILGGLALSEQFRQPRYVHGDPSRLVFRDHVRLTRFGLDSTSSSTSTGAAFGRRQNAITQALRGC